jgi:para-nitrobenzyl esterase
MSGKRNRPAMARTALATGVLLACGAPCALAQSGPVVKTDKGSVEGFISNGLAEFLGVPYAAPPIGDLRWKPPQPHAAWTGTLETTSFAPICAQVTTLGVFAGPANNNEDCLYLNIYTPDLSTTAGLPVFVWIHGGGNVDGEANDYDGSKLAMQGQMVVVIFNYRLGLLGFMANPALDSEGHAFGSYGLLDQQAVLQWVKTNATKFGGDPSNVTLGGQSAGSVDTSANMVSPLAKGLFEHSIFESILVDSTPLASAEAVGTAFAKAAGCGTGSSTTIAKCLRNLSAGQIMALEGTTSTSGPYVQNVISDGTIIPTAGIFASFKSGKFNHMPVMSGTVHDEYNFVIAIDEYFESPRVPVTATQYEDSVKAQFGAKADKVLAEYPVASYPTAQLAWDAEGPDSLVCPQYEENKVLSTQVPVYAYEFNDQNIPSYFPKMPGFQPLAYHTGDIQFLFPLWHGGPLGIPHKLNAQQRTLSDELVAAWANFAWTGNPNGEGNSPWPQYIARSTQPSYYLSENVPELTTMTADEFASEHKCSFWKSL